MRAQPYTAHRDLDRPFVNDGDAGAGNHGELRRQYITQASIVRHVSNGTEYGAYVFDAHENTTNAANGVVHAGAVSRSGTTLTNSIVYGNRYIPWCSLGSKIFSEGDAHTFSACSADSRQTHHGWQVRTWRRPIRWSL